LVCRLLHTLKSEDADSQFALLALARERLQPGGPLRLRRTLVPLVCRALKLARQLHAVSTSAISVSSVTPAALIEWVHATLGKFPTEAADISLRLYLQAALVADGAGLEQLAYDSVTQAFILFEDELSDSKAQTAAIAIAVGTLHATSGFSRDNYETLATKASQYSARLLKKPDQCRALARASHLYWTGDTTATAATASSAAAATATTAGSAAMAADEGAPATAAVAAAAVVAPALATVRVQEGGVRDGKRVRECLQRAAKAADACKAANGQHVPLLLELLDTHLFYFEKATDDVTPELVAGLLREVAEQIGAVRPSADPAAVAAMQAHYAATLQHVRARAAALTTQADAAAARYGALLATAGTLAP